MSNHSSPILTRVLAIPVHPKTAPRHRYFRNVNVPYSPSWGYPGRTWKTMVEQGITGDSQGWYGTISDKLQCGTIISVAEQVLDECEGLQQEYVFDVCEAPVFDHSDLEYPFYFDCCRQFTIPHSSDSTTRPTGRMRKLQIMTAQRPASHHEWPFWQLSRGG